MNIQSVLIVDDHPMYRKGIEDAMKSFIEGITFFHANNGVQAIDLVNSNNIDLIFMDIQMPLLNGIEATKRIRLIHPKIKIVGLSMFEDMHSVIRMLEAGVNGYSIKYIDINDLKNIINTVMNGNFYISHEVAHHLDSYVRYKEGLRPNQPMPELSNREISVLVMVCQQLSSKEIGLKLGISEKARRDD